MKIKVINRPPNDLFTMRLFYRLVHDVTVPANAIYMWTLFVDKYLDPLSDTNNEPTTRRELVNAIDTDLVILGIKDHFTGGWFNPYIESKPNLLIYFEQMFEFYSDKTFIVFTSTENLKFNSPNAHVINWGGDLTNQQFEYRNLEPVTDKNLDSKFSYISLNRNHRYHRTFALSALYGLDLQDTGFITCMFQDDLPETIEDMNCPLTSDTETVFRQGFTKLKSAVLTKQDDYKIYPKLNNDNVSNFKNCLSNYYKDTFVEIITETSFTESCYLLTEKTLNSIYGCNFPILLCGKGSVSFLRNMGLDVFDDVIDHSYDDIADPLQRIFFAIERNKGILNNPALAKRLWVENRQRFLKNIEFAKTDLYKYYQTRTEQQWKNLRYLYDNISQR